MLYTTITTTSYVLLRLMVTSCELVLKDQCAKFATDCTLTESKLLLLLMLSFAMDAGTPLDQFLHTYQQTPRSDL